MALVRGGKVRPHVQAFADAVTEATGVQSIGTYPGHSPSIDRALDLFVPVNSTAVGNAICAFALKHQARFGVRYVIYRREIWHREDPTWRWMADRGGPTQNHVDHVHVSFEPTAMARPQPPPVVPAPPNPTADPWADLFVPILVHR